MADEGTMPIRMFMDDPDIQWRNGIPDYTKTDELYLEGKCFVGALGFGLDGMCHWSLETPRS